MMNYITDAYGVYAASVLAACSAMRSILGAILPLAIDKMLDALGIAWSCTTLAGISLVLGAVPFGFIAWGDKIRLASKLSQQYQRQETRG